MASVEILETQYIPRDVAIFNVDANFLKGSLEIETIPRWMVEFYFILFILYQYNSRERSICVRYHMESKS